MERAQRAAERRRLDEEKKLMQHKKTQVYTCICTGIIHVLVAAVLKT